MTNNLFQTPETIYYKKQLLMFIRIKKMTIGLLLTKSENLIIIFSGIYSDFNISSGRTFTPNKTFFLFF
ncbi:hypothetical protein Mgra_00000783 [Meloidogyne graminicola]|uniref:Uncharacterized protein n=1 Tax=Meloidogyne graminicola TaxID=189291 RepID=A0A8T0A4K7_9BILA|nr:hypothetical protein Mgra_00000783 [Meloidogyne graminicola]